MHITVNGARLFFDVDGAGLVPDGPAMRQRPTLVLLHGGPGGDHSTFKPAFDGLRDVAQLDPEFQQRLLRARVQRVEGQRVAGAPDEDEDGSEGEKGG